jgi:hypothetical protein
MKKEARRTRHYIREIEHFKPKKKEEETAA